MRRATPSLLSISGAGALASSPRKSLAAAPAARATTTRAPRRQQPKTASVAPAVALKPKTKPRTANGIAVLRYNHYRHELAVKRNAVRIEAIDELFLFSAVFRGSFVVTLRGPDGVVLRPGAGSVVAADTGICIAGVVPGAEYWILVEQDAEAEATVEKRIFKSAEAAAAGGDGSSVAAVESCSCIYGNPCVDRYLCQDWGNRYAVSRTNGWDPSVQ